MPKQNTPDLLAGGVSKHYLVGVAVVGLFDRLVHDGGLVGFRCQPYHGPEQLEQPLSPPVFG
jgi:hypothetical protein